MESLTDEQAKPDRESSTTRFVSAEQALSRVSALTGTRREELLEVACGPAANPARRFAVWALRQWTQLTQKEIGRVLGMSESQVAHVLKRLDLHAEPFDAWSDTWLARE